VRALARKNWRIKVATRHPNRAFFLRPLGQVGQIGFIKCDVSEPDQVAHALSGSHAVVNLAGILVQRGQTFQDVHANGPGVIAETAARHGIKSLVHVSAIGADAESHSRYAETKGEGETRVRRAFPSATILRPSLLFGPEDRFFNRFAELARFFPALPLIGGGRTRFQPVFVGDVAQAIVTALDDVKAQGKTYELGGPTIYSFKELMEIILSETGRKRILMPIPFGLATLQAIFLQLLPNPLLTPDQVKLLRRDNVVSPTAHTLKDLGIQPTTVEAEVPAYLWRFRAKGEYAELARIK
ncbi:MAG TPA: complex I NDUFA9 subunit family protein, partial [Rhizomicrobium sp.]|nr:complex I NDUFA9 subunit family protein [Rhizomicrobium sp.]